MDIVMTRNTLWQNQIIKIGTEFTVPTDIGAGMIRRNVAREKGISEVPAFVAPEKKKKIK
jgi:hypothetical protein